MKALTVMLMACPGLFSQAIERLEYFVNADPGFGNATSIAITPSNNISNLVGNINLTDVSYGLNRLYVRSKSNNHWSLTESIAFFKLNMDQENIIRAEYFFDSDPGFGNAISINITPGPNIGNLAFPVNISSLPPGFHRIYVRSFDGADWSLTYNMLFFKGVDPGAPISRIEYFFDTDPGFGLATPIAITPGQNIGNLSIPVSLSGLDNGIHFLHVRSYNVNAWSLTNITAFYKWIQPQVNIEYAEYFIDNDPGFGNGSQIDVVAANAIEDLSFPVALNGLANGDHLFFIRTRDAKGDWSITNIRPFKVEGNLPVSWGSFTAKANEKENSIDLFWQTLTESNTARFTIERKNANMPGFDSIGSVDAAGESIALREYNFSDKKIKKDAHYLYRLKQVDKDGKFSYSPLRSAILRSSEHQIQVYPTLVETGAVQIKNGRKGQLLRIYSADGQLRLSQKLTNGNEQILLPAFTLKGTNFVVISENEKVIHTEKIVVH